MEKDPEAVPHTIGYTTDVSARAREAGPRVVGLRELNHQTGEIVAAVEAGEPVVITRQRRPVAAIVPIDEARAQDFMLGAAPGSETATTRADAEVERGQTIPFGAVLESLAPADVPADAAAWTEGGAGFDVLVSAVASEIVRQLGLEPQGAAAEATPTEVPEQVKAKVEAARRRRST